MKKEMDMLEDKIIDLLSKKTKCPVCGEECISWYKKGFYTNFWKEKECPNCKATLKLKGKIIWVNRLIDLFFLIWYIFLFINIPQLCSLLLLFYICFKLFWKVLVVGPFSEIVPYNSTPLDDLLNSFRKLKGMDKKGKIKVAAVITAVVLAFVGIGVCINHRKNIENNLTDLTYDIVQESCDNYGDYSKSKYQDIVSE